MNTPHQPPRPLPPLAALSDAQAEHHLSDWAARLRAAGYDQSIIAQAETIAPGMMDVVRLPAVHHRLRKTAGPAAVMARLFSYADSVTDAEASACLGGALCEWLRAAGVLDAAPDGGLVARFRVTPIEDLFLISDPMDAGPEAVMGPGATTWDLIGLVPKASSALDVGCGAGTLALVAARRGALRAVGVDINPRAIELSRLNARWNGIEAEFRCGDLLAPIAGESFALVVSQPPYVVAPPDVAGTTYLHGGAHGNAIALRLLAALPAALAPGGRALVMFDTGVRTGEALAGTVRAALGVAPLDVAVLTAPAPTPDTQAVAYASLQAPGLGPGYAAAVSSYASHLDTLGFARWVRALAVVERGPGPGPRYTLALPVSSLRNGQADALTTYLAGLVAASRPTEELLALVVRCPAGSRLVEERDVDALDEPPRYSLALPAHAIAVNRELTDVGALLLTFLVRGRVSDAVEPYARACEASPQDVLPQVIGFVREGLSRGFLCVT